MACLRSMGRVEMDTRLINKMHGSRMAARQIDELIGLARGLVADGKINQAEAEFLYAWLAANSDVVDNPVIEILYLRVSEIMADGIADDEECAELFDTLRRFVDNDVAPGELLKPTTLPLNDPEPALLFDGMRYCFTGTFNFGQRKACEAVVIDRGGRVGGIAQSTNVLVIGSYVTDAWKHSSFGNKIMQAVEWRSAGHPIAIVSETHWRQHI